jgi:hypothetical protein
MSGGSCPCDLTPENMLRSKRRRERAAMARNRHETVNGRMKNFEALTGIFRHDKVKHGVVCSQLLARPYLI